MVEPQTLRQGEDAAPFLDFGLMVDAVHETLAIALVEAVEPFILELLAKDLVIASALRRILTTRAHGMLPANVDCDADR
jgi:hypothetical protein